MRGIPFQSLFGTLAVFFGALTSVHASSVVISMKATDAPAVDLIYNGKPIDRDQAVDLKKRGVDLSLLNPTPNDVWTPTPLPAKGEPDVGYPADGAIVAFDTNLPTSNSMFRTRVISGEGAEARPFQLMMSLGGHAAMARAALLRRLGYPIPTPRRYRTLTVRFPDSATRGKFLDDLSDATLTSRSRWIEGKLVEGDTSVTFRDVILEPAQIDIPMYHWGVIPSTHLKGRRALRALIVPLVLLDVTESINLFSWELGKTIDNSVILTHPYAESFNEIAYEDARWIARRLARLTRADLEEAVRLGEYPDDVGKLVAEKVIARRNHLVEMFHLDKELDKTQRSYPYNVKLSTGAVKNGKLTKSDYDGYALRFMYGDPESPLRKAEIARYFAVKGLSSVISAACGYLDSYLVAQSTGDVIQKHAADVMKDYFQFQHDHPGETYSRPLSAWAGPIGSAAVHASRNIVSGTYYGGESKVQLVDNLAVQVSGGFFMGVDGVPVVGIGATGNVLVQRNYIHVRPLPDMKTAIKSNWANIFIPKFMGELGRSLDTSGANGDQTKIDEKLRGFLDSLKEGEMVMVTDSLVAGVKGQFNVAIPIFAIPILNPALGLGVGTQPMILKRTTFRRTAEGVQVYLQTAEVLQADVSFNFNWIVNILKLTHTSKTGWGQTRAYLLDREPDSPETRRHLVVALRALFHSHDSEVLEDNFKYYKLNHRTTAHIEAANILWWKFAGVKESHKVIVRPPDQPNAARTLFAEKVTSIRGIDGFGFLSDIVAGLSKGLVVMGSSNSSGYNPANSFLGRSKWVTWSTEAEITPDVEFAPVTTIAHHFGGWSIKPKGLMKVLDGMEKSVKSLNLEHGLVRRDEFATTKSLQLFELLSTLIIYQAGMKRISETVFEPPKVQQVVDLMTEIEGRDELKKWCGKTGRKIANTMFRIHQYTEREDGKKIKFKCVKPWMKSMLKYRHDVRAGKAPKSPENRVKWTNAVMKTLEKKMELRKLLGWLGKDNFFFQIRVSGFRTKDENGDSEYLSDSVGSFDGKQGGGIFRDFAAKYGIMTSELTANYLSVGY